MKLYWNILMESAMGLSVMGLVVSSYYHYHTSIVVFMFLFLLIYIYILYIVTNKRVIPFWHLPFRNKRKEKVYCPK